MPSNENCGFKICAHKGVRQIKNIFNSEKIKTSTELETMHNSLRDFFFLCIYLQILETQEPFRI